MRGHDGRTACAAVGVRDEDAVDVRLGDLRVLAHHVADFVGGDILRVPAESVAEAVDEVDAPVGVLAVHVAGAEPHVVLGEDVAHEAFLGLADLLL